MLNRRHAAAQKVAARLHPIERTIEAQIVDTAQLTIAMIQARKEARIPFMTGQAALEKVLATSAHLAAARRTIGEAHAELNTVQHDIGLGQFAYGDTGEPKEKFFTGASEDEGLRVVA